MGHISTCKILLQDGFPVNARDHQGYTALHLACMEGHLDVVIELIKFGKDIFFSLFKPREFEWAKYTLYVSPPFLFRIYPKAYFFLEERRKNNFSFE